MERTKLTQPLVESLKPRGTLYDVADTAMPGFMVRVQPSGKRSYYIRYNRPDNAKETRYKVASAEKWTCSQARNQAKKLLAAVERGEDPNEEQRSRREALTLGEFMETVYRPWAEAELKDGNGNANRIKAAFKDFLMVRLSALSRRDMEKWRMARHAEVAGATTNRDFNALRAALNRAVEWGYLSVNPLAGLKLSRIDKMKAPRFLTEEEEDRLLAVLDAREERLRLDRDSANAWRKERDYPQLPDLRKAAYADHLKPMVLLALHTGMRRGEIFNLAWRDIDFERRMLTVQGGGAKSGQSRHIPINDPLAAMLQAWRAQQDDTAGLVFISPKTGGRFDNIRKAWTALREEAGLSDVRFHDLRHSFASNLVRHGVDLYVVKELLGHSTIAMTEIYSHLQPEAKAAAVAKLARPRGNVVPFTGSGG